MMVVKTLFSGSKFAVFHSLAFKTKAAIGSIEFPLCLNIRQIVH